MALLRSVVRVIVTLWLLACAVLADASAEGPGDPEEESPQGYEPDSAAPQQQREAPTANQVTWSILTNPFRRIPDEENPFKNPPGFPWQLLLFSICLGLVVTYGSGPRRGRGKGTYKRKMF